ncbi:hypothetical protein C8F04DRAFT_1140763 [Mycena alexandri]|uniref:Uncharacterized protein n=1 Tax=Mycena alexandri TaxID=1745969 RepID=A0AAD6S6I3_9AGAR|nr:hypothetical protein C8F04DRAFT_1140763 [Mycena alexandri]
MVSVFALSSLSQVLLILAALKNLRHLASPLHPPSTPPTQVMSTTPHILMSRDEENTFIDSFIDYTGGMPLTPPPVATSLHMRRAPATTQESTSFPSRNSAALDLLATHVTLKRPSTVQNGGGGSLLPEKLVRATATANENGHSGNSLSQLLAPSLTELGIKSASVSTTFSQVGKVAEPILASTSSTAPLPLPTRRRKLNTLAIHLTNGGRSVFPAQLDSSIPEPDLSDPKPVWVSCFSDEPSTISGAERDDEDDVFHSSPPPSPSAPARRKNGRGANKSHNRRDGALAPSARQNIPPSAAWS